MKIVCIGHSIVNGFPFDRKDSFPNLLNEELKPETNVLNRGINGQTTEDILNRFSKDAIEPRPDLIFLMAGTNDFIFNLDKPQGSFEKTTKMQELCDAQGIKLVHMTPTPISIEQAAKAWPATDAEDYLRVSRELQEFIYALREAAEQGKIHLLDIYTEYEDYGLLYDGIHPTQEGQKIIAKACLKYLRRIKAQERGLRIV